MRGIAAVPGSRSPRLVDAPQPAAPAAGQILCRTLELGICGTDREILHSREPKLPPGHEHLILGHECLARVEELGPAGASSMLPLSAIGVESSAPPLDESRTLEVGDLVVPVVRRPRAPSPRRVDMLAPGRFTERGIFFEHGFSTPYWLDEPRYLVRVPKALARVAVFTEPMAVAEKGINEALILQRARLEEGIWQATPPRVLVTGLGPIAFAALLASRVRGWPTTVYGRDDAASRRAMLVAEFGGEYLSAPLARFDERDPEAEGFDLILECTGSDELLIRAAASLASCGVMVWLGSSRTPRPGDHQLARFIRQGLLGNHLHIGCVNAAPRDFLEGLMHLGEWHRRAPQAVARLFTERVAPEESLSHYENRTPQGIKTVLVYE